MKNNLVRISRFLVGIIFIFSGVVKCVDPLGTAYKIEEYLNVFGLHSLADTFPSLLIAISIIQCSLELVLGLMLLFGVFRKATSWIVLLLMLFFTILTLSDAITNKVSDCGCFGDAIILTNWETFWKNIVIDIFVIILFTGRNTKKLRRRTTLGKPIALTILFSILSIGFGVFNYLYEPILDFRPWKEGNRMLPKPEDRLPSISYALYLNNSSNEEKEFTMEELMQAFEQNPDFSQEWTWISSRIENPTTIAAEGFSMISSESNEDATLNIIGDDDFVFLITCYDLKTVRQVAMPKVKQLLDKATAKGIKVVLLTSSLTDEYAPFIHQYELQNIEIYTADEKAIKTMMRSNPGVLLMKKGMVVKKWSNRSIPAYGSIDFISLAKKAE